MKATELDREARIFPCRQCGEPTLRIRLGMAELELDPIAPLRYLERTGVHLLASHDRVCRARKHPLGAPEWPEGAIEHENLYVIP